MRRLLAIFLLAASAALAQTTLPPVIGPDYVWLFSNVQADDCIRRNGDNTAWVNSTSCGGGTLTVQESDASPSVTSTTIEFLASEFVVTDQTGGVSRVVLGTVGEAKIDSAVTRDAEVGALAAAAASVTAGAGAVPKGDGTGRLDTNWLGSGAPDGDTVLLGNRTWVQLDYSQLSGVPLTFAPSAHVTSHHSGGGDALALGSLAGTLSNAALDAAGAAFGAGSGIDYDSGTDVLAFDPTEVGNPTWAAGGTATQTWTWNLTGTNPSIVFGDNAVTVNAASVTMAGLSIEESQISDLAHFGGAFSDLTGAATDGQIPDTITLTSIGQAGDVDLAGLADGNCLVYDGTTDNRFEPGACGSGGAEVNDLEGDGASGIASGEVFVGNGAGTGTYRALAEADISDLAHTTDTTKTIEDEGTPLTTRSTMNFTGDGVAVTDAGGKTVVTITAGAGGGSGTEVLTAEWPVPAGLAANVYSKYIPADGTATKFWCRAPSGDTFDVQIVQREIGVGTSNTFSSAVTCDDSPALVTVFADSSLTAGHVLELNISNVTGSPADGDELYVYLEATTPGGTVADDAIGTAKLDDGANPPVVGYGVAVASGGLDFEYKDFLEAGDPGVVTPTDQQTLENKTALDLSYGEDSGPTRRVDNDTATGTTVNRTAKTQNNGSNREEAVIATTSDTGIPVYVVKSGAGTTGKAELTRDGLVQADADGACAIGDNVVSSVTVGGEVTCTPTAIAQDVFCIGRAAQTTLAAGLAWVAVGDLCTRQGNDARVIASGTAALGTSAITSTNCATVVTASATGVLTTDSITWTPNADITAVTGYAPSTSGGLAIYPYPTANNVNFKVCNPTSGSITPGAVTLNWQVVR